MIFVFSPLETCTPFTPTVMALAERLPSSRYTDLAICLQVTLPLALLPNFSSSMAQTPPASAQLEEFVAFCITASLLRISR